MDIFDEMNKYRKGEHEGDIHHFSVPLEPDEDGMLGRECPSEYCQPRYFKISNVIPDEMEDLEENFSTASLTCPYCGTQDNMQSFHTEAQLDWIYSMMERDVIKAFHGVLESAFKPSRSSSKGLFSISISFKPGSLPSVRHYVEDKLKTQVTCDACGFNYSVYGISFWCPLCGYGNLLEHLHASAKTIKVLLEESREIANKYGDNVGTICEEMHLRTL